MITSSDSSTDSCVDGAELPTPNPLGQAAPDTDLTNQATSLKHGLTASAFLAPPEPIGPDERQEIYRRAGIPLDTWPELECIVLESPARFVGKGALDNVVGGLYSRKSGNIRPFESHTVERPYLYQLELDPTVIAYFTQARLPNVEGIGRTGKRYVTSVTADVIVFRHASVTVVECKSESWLNAEVARPGSKWIAHDSHWTRTDLESWSASRGLSFEVFAQETISAIELQNLEFMYAMLRETASARDEALISRGLRVLSDGPKTILELRAHVPGFNNRHTGLILARGLAYGMLRSQSIDLEDHFLLFDDRDHAAEADRTAFTEIVNDLAPIDVSRPILRATPSDVQIAIARHAKIMAMRNGIGKVSERTRRLERQMIKGVRSGLTEIESLLSKTYKSGNRRLRCDARLPKIIEDTIKLFWTSGKVSDISALWVELEKACKKEGVVPCSESRLRIAVRESSTAKRLLAIGGMRAYQAGKASTPADRRSLPPLAFGHTLHIDSSPLDNRLAPNLVTLFPSESARFYIGIDGATCLPMASSLIFGPARTDGLAILLRDYVARNGFLPSHIFLDRGSENTSKWFRQFCREAGIGWSYSPTGGSRYNGQAENAIGRVNRQFAHKLPGSTEPDQRGRAVDGKFKSRRNAQLTFSALASEFDVFVYGDLANCPNEKNISPRELADEKISFGETAGRPAQLDAAFLILTSVPTNTTPKIQHGYVRTSFGRFSSVEFQAASGTKMRVDELRSDCVDPSVLYARLGTNWYQIFNRDVLRLSQLSEREKLWELLCAPIDSANARATKLEAKKKRYKRHAEMAEAAAANQGASPTSAAGDANTGKQEECSENFDWDSLNDFDEQ